MRLVQFETPMQGRRLGVVVDAEIVDITSLRPDLQRVLDAFRGAQAAGRSLADYLSPLAEVPEADRVDYAQLREAVRAGEAQLHPPVDHPDAFRVLVSGTGLTHGGGMESRDAMHAEPAADAPPTDSRRMFQWGLEGGQPQPGQRGAAPEWFYKGDGSIVRGWWEPLDLPPFALDGGEEPELVGCYVVDHHGVPRRLGFALGNEWTDHATEKLNYLYLAPAKLRACSVGPELVLDWDFQSLTLQCTVSRGGQTLYDSGPLHTGQRHMCHSLANLEDHHFKFPQHRQPNTMHLHFLGTSRISYGQRDWKYADGDVLRIEAPGFSEALVNRVRAIDSGREPIEVASA